MNHPRQPVPSGDELGLCVCVLIKEGRNQRLVERTGTRYFELAKLHKQAFVFWFQKLRASPGCRSGFPGSGCRRRGRGCWDPQTEVGSWWSARNIADISISVF